MSVQFRDKAQYRSTVRLVMIKRRRVGEEGWCTDEVVLVVKKGSHEVSKDLNTHYLVKSQQFRGSGLNGN